MKKLISCIVLLFVVVDAFSQLTSWQKSYYDRYDHTTFSKFEPFNATIDSERFDYELLNAAVFFETNRQRVLNGKKPFKHHDRLGNCAQGHSDDMVAYKFFAHESLARGRYSLSDRARIYSVPSEYLGENICNNYTLRFNGQAYYPPSQAGFFKSISGQPIAMHTYVSLAIEMVKSWMNSPGHRANILNSEFTHLGVGNALHFTGSGIDRIPWVKGTQNFAAIKPSFIVRKESRSPNYSYSTSSGVKLRDAGYGQYSSYSGGTLNYKQSRPSRLSITLGVATVLGKGSYFSNNDVSYQAVLYTGILKGERGRGQNFYGLFSSLDFDSNCPITLETGAIFLRFLRLSGGVRCEFFGDGNSLVNFMPSLTTGLRINLGGMFFDLNMNVYQNQRRTDGRFIAAVGACF
jgi:uncharacterized protein YkwD